MNVITGIAGFVGGNLARALLAQGQEVRGLIHKDDRAVAGLDIQRVSGDLHDLESLKRAFQKADMVFHLAASITLDGVWSRLEAVNVTGTRNVVEACLAAGVRRLVHCSSIHAFEQAPLDQPLDETRPLAVGRHHPVYDRSKAAAELEVQKGQERGLEVVILNPTAILGPYDFKPSYLGKAILAMARGELPALVEGGFDWVDVRDVVFGMIQAAQGAPNGSKYLISGHWRSVVDLSKRVAEFTYTSPPRLTAPLWLAYLGLPFIHLLSHFNHKEQLYTRFSLQTLKSNRLISHDRATRELDYRPRPFEESIADTISWFQANGYLD
jgi:dihydroflavonol-4-reductase